MAISERDGPKCPECFGAMTNIERERSIHLATICRLC
jgi:hypothetical protein